MCVFVGGGGGGGLHYDVFIVNIGASRLVGYL